MKVVEDYAREVQALLQKARIYTDVDVTGNTLQKKTQGAQVAQYNFTMDVGAQEIEARIVNIRNRDDPSSQQKGAMIDLEDVITRLKVLKSERRLINSV